MVSSPEIVHAIADTLVDVKAEHIVVDPVMVATSGSSLIVSDAIEALISRLLPLAEVATPNLPEAQALSGIDVIDDATMLQAAQTIQAMGVQHVLVKGGHLSGCADDVLYTSNGEVAWLRSERVDTANTHGTGCTLSSAIACGLALGKEVTVAVRDAKEYITGALSCDMHLGHGSGPVNHFWRFR